jgi:hypothetical protein
MKKLEEQEVTTIFLSALMPRITLRGKITKNWVILVCMSIQNQT